jgi:hypothetical protein
MKPLDVLKKIFCCWCDTDTRDNKTIELRDIDVNTQNTTSKDNQIEQLQKIQEICKTHNSTVDDNTENKTPVDKEDAISRNSSVMDIQTLQIENSFEQDDEYKMTTPENSAELNRDNVF